MFLSITHANSGETLLLRRVSPTETLDLRTHVRRWVDGRFGECEEPVRPSFSEPGAHIPSGGGEYEAELRNTKAPGASCWTSEPFFVVPLQDAALAA